jgi:hypothetical protein
MQINALTEYAPFHVPETGWTRLEGVEDLAQTTGLAHTVYGCELETGLKLIAMQGAGGVMVSVADGREIWELPQRLADQVWRVAHVCMKSAPV